MVIAEIEDLVVREHFANVEPFIYEIRPARVVYASWWSDIFGLPSYDKDYTIVVGSFIRDYTTKYNETISYEDLKLSQGSFFWDNSAQILYVHFEHDQEGLTAVYQYGSSWGFSDTKPCYLDDQQYIPLIKSSPSFSQSQDIENYDKLNFISGSLTILNGEMMLRGEVVGISDNLIDSNMYGNQVYLYYYPDDQLDEFGNGDRDNLVRLGAFYIEDYDISLQQATFSLQDIRKAGDITIPNELFESDDYPNIGDYEDTVIPLMFGTVREATAIPTNSDILTGDVNYRVALEITDLGTVYVGVDNVWTLATAINTSLSTGEFSLSSAEGRDSSGSLRDVKVVSPTGIVIAKTSDIIIYLNEKYLGVTFVDSFYNTTEWNLEAESLTTGGMLISDETVLYDAVKEVQNGSIVGFRYEISPDGRRTIRIDDPDRASSGFISNVVVANRNTMPVSTDSSQVYANIKTKYNKSYNSGKYITNKNSDYANSVLVKYKNVTTLTTETILNNETDAITRSEGDALKFSEIPKILKWILTGEEYLDLRIFDIKELEITPGFGDADTEVVDGRTYYGYRKGKVVGINPDGATRKNTVSFKLLEE